MVRTRNHSPSAAAGGHVYEDHLGHRGFEHDVEARGLAFAQCSVCSISEQSLWRRGARSAATDKFGANCEMG